jgi:integrase
MKKSATQERYFSESEIQNFLQALHESENESARDFIQLMRWDRLDLHNKKWQVPLAENEEFFLPLLEPAIKILKRRKEGRQDDFVFSDLSNVKVKKAWTEILERAGIQHLAMSSLRRSIASYPYLDHKRKKEQRK